MQCIVNKPIYTAPCASLASHLLFNNTLLKTAQIELHFLTSKSWTLVWQVMLERSYKTRSLLLDQTKDGPTNLIIKKK